MLSAETAAGPYPVDAVKMMARIAKQTEAWMWKEDSFGKLQYRTDEVVRPLPYGDAVADATAKLCFDLRARAIVCITTSGRSAVTLSAARPAAPLLAISSDVKVCRRMNLYWGVIPVLSDQAGQSNPNVLGREAVLKEKLASKGDHIILVRGFHAEEELNTPTITMLTV
jgi:pyruvate kinase